MLRGIQLPASPERLRAWLMEKKLAKYRKDDNKAEAGGNWPVFDWANQFLQTRAELTEATLDLLTRLAEDGVKEEKRLTDFAEVRLELEQRMEERASGKKKIVIWRKFIDISGEVTIYMQSFIFKIFHLKMMQKLSFYNIARCYFCRENYR